MENATLALMCIEGIGPRTYKSLCDAFGSAESVFLQDKRTLIRSCGISAEAADMIVKKTYRKKMDFQLEWMYKHKAAHVSMEDSTYPDVLRHIYDAPPLLIYTGSFAPEDNTAFAVVGTRYPDNYGKLMTEQIAGGIAKNGICIISGMARGIDTAAHRAALTQGSRTIAVLGTSLDCIYPAENHRIFREIAEHGAVCTETVIGGKILPGNFIRRNRIISGLSRGVVVTQAGTRSGALVTALNANEQNRDVFAVPGNSLNGRHTGCHRLIRLGAKIVENAEDVLSEYPFLRDRLKGQKDCFAEAARQSPLNREEELVLACLDKEGVYIDRIIESCALGRPAVMNALLNLEIKGYVQRGKGDIYRRGI